MRPRRFARSVAVTRVALRSVRPSMTEACSRAATSAGTDLSLNLAEMLAPLIGSPGAPIVDEYCFLQSRFADENIFAIAATRSRSMATSTRADSAIPLNHSTISPASARGGQPHREFSPRTWRPKMHSRKLLAVVSRPYSSAIHFGVL
jgi:hypothetical protein